VFTTERGGRRLTRNALGYILRQLDAALTPHALRRTFAINSLRAGMDLFTLARLMGHESIDTLKQYLDLVEGDLESAHRRFSVLDQL
jgi:site-specific recombinase XerD